MAEQFNCVRVSHIIKNVGRENVVRHIDDLLIQAKEIIGEVAYCYIYRNAQSNNDDNIDTLGHIMLKNPQNHKQLAFMLNGFNFHGRNLLAALSYHYFSSIDDDYYPRPLKHVCNYCNRFEDFVVQKENKIKQDAIDRSIRNVHVYNPSNRIKYNHLTKENVGTVNIKASQAFKHLDDDEHLDSYIEVKSATITINRCNSVNNNSNDANFRSIEPQQLHTPMIKATSMSSIVVIDEGEDANAI